MGFLCHRFPQGLEDVSKYPNLIQELLRRGWKEDDLADVLQRNFMRVFKEVERVSAATTPFMVNSGIIFQSSAESRVTDPLTVTGPGWVEFQSSQWGADPDRVGSEPLQDGPETPWPETTIPQLCSQIQGPSWTKGPGNHQRSTAAVQPPQHFINPFKLLSLQTSSTWLFLDWKLPNTAVVSRKCSKLQWVHVLSFVLWTLHILSFL